MGESKSKYENLVHKLSTCEDHLITTVTTSTDCQNKYNSFKSSQYLLNKETQSREQLCLLVGIIFGILFVFLVSKKDPFYCSKEREAYKKAFLLL